MCDVNHTVISFTTQLGCHTLRHVSKTTTRKDTP
nr:MAG TPA: hypothetical protein [Caudoviricetes sp.]